MTYPWQGEARRALAGDFARVAEELGCERAALQAVWRVEAAGAPFLTDGGLTRRFEPHKLARPDGTWKTSLKIGAAERERRFLAAYQRDPQDACRATSWGAPQIMGFNAAACGYSSAVEMVRAFADSEAEQLRGFAAFVRSSGLDSALRARDWRTFALTYNGSGQVEAYAARMEAAYRDLAGRASPVVLRLGDRGEAVSRLQQALGVRSDGSFGKLTDEAVRSFQRAQGLPVDGVVGARTWAALEERRDAAPLVQPTPEDRAARWGQIAGGAVPVLTAVGGLGAALPETTLNILAGGAVVCGIGSLALWAWRRQRRVA